MMKNTQRKNTRGAALMIALITAVAVMLAATLLIALTEKMVDSCSQRLIDSQIALSEASGADYISFLLEKNGSASAEEVFSYELAGVRTEFSLAGSSNTGVRRGVFQIDNPQDAVLIPAGSGIVLASRPLDGLVELAFYENDTFQSYSEIYLETEMLPLAGTAINVDGETVIFLLLQGSGETMIAMCDQEELRAQVVFPGEKVTAGSRVTASVSETGEPMVIVTDGSNGATLFSLGSGEMVNLSSPPGTCPVFMEDGSIFGNPNSQSPVFSFVRVKDVFFGDFNSDGAGDIAFASPYALSAFSGGTGEVAICAPGGNLVCWGDVQGRSGLVGMWSTAQDEKWFRLGWDGFSEFTPEAAFRLGWSGRFTSSGSTYVGFLNGATVVASSSGYQMELFDTTSIMADLDGGYLDFITLGEEGLEAVYNPLSGEGITYRYTSRNFYRGRENPGNTYLFSVYDSDGGFRVYHSINGGE